MRKRTLIAVSAAIALAAVGTVAFANDNDDNTSEPVRVAKGTGATVTLPTGDTATVSSGGLMWKPAEGREDVSHVTLPAHDGSGDIIAIPKDKLDDIAAGKEDPRRYNVSELLRRGETNAAKATRLSDKPYGRFVPAGDAPRDSADKQNVTFTVTDHSGKPTEGDVSYVDVKTGDIGEMVIGANGKGKVSLPPGEYDFLSMTASGDETVLGINTVTVKTKPVDFAFDGAKGKKVSYKVDRSAELTDHTVGVFSYPPETGYAMTVTTVEAKPVYVIPTGKLDKRTGMEAEPHLEGGGDADPYTYDLALLHRGGVPEDPSYVVHDDELAQVTRKFDGLATTAPTTNCNAGFNADGISGSICQMRKVSWQSQRTELFTASPDVKWLSHTEVGDVTDDHYISLDDKSTYEAGPSERVVGHAPSSLNMRLPADDKRTCVERKGDELSAYLPFLDNANPSELIVATLPMTGEAVLKRDGEEIGREDTKTGGFTFTLPDKDSGRYSLSAQVKHDGSFTPLATETSVEWEFASKPSEAAVPAEVSAVAFDAEGISNGSADVGKEQKFTLEYRPQSGATDTKLKDLTFEVSYDDGKTWEKVDITVDGDKAAGTLKHPKSAKSVSVKATASDDAGNKVTHSTVDAYLLK